MSHQRQQLPMLLFEASTCLNHPEPFATATPILASRRPSMHLRAIDACLAALHVLFCVRAPFLSGVAQPGLSCWQGVNTLRIPHCAIQLRAPSGGGASLCRHAPNSPAAAAALGSDEENVRCCGSIGIPLLHLFGSCAISLQV